MRFRQVLGCVLVSLGVFWCASAPAQEGPQWPQQIQNPLWMPHIGYMRQSTAIAGQAIFGPKLTWKGNSSSVEWSLVSPPAGMVINSADRIEWDVPVEGRYLVQVKATVGGEVEQASWYLNVVKTEFPNPVVFSTKHIDYVVPAWYGQWMEKVNAAKIVDGYYEFGRDLVGLPCDARQSVLCSPSIGGAHNGIPICSGTGTFGDTDAEHWKLGFLFHELGHNLNPYVRVDYLEGGDHQLDVWLHGMVEFDKIAWVVRMLAAPDKQGTHDVENFTQWMKAESMEFVDGYQKYMAQVPSGAKFISWTDGPSGVWAGFVHEYAFTYGEEAVERVLRLMRRDGLALGIYPEKHSSTDRLTILLCVMSVAARQDLLKKYQAMHLPVNLGLYRRFYPDVVRTMNHLPALGINGAVKCPVDGHFYCLTPYHMSWAEAEATARRLGGHLATIRSQEQEQWLATLFGRNGWMWVGASRDNSSGSWSWITHEITAAPLWEPERPESDPNKIYGVLILHEDGSKPENGWFGLANRPADENQIGIMEFTHAPTTDTDSLN